MCDDDVVTYHTSFENWCGETNMDELLGDHGDPTWDDLVLIVANTLSMLTIVSCLFMKIPQIVAIRQKQSAEGIYIQALAMEILGFTIMTLYSLMNNYGPLTYLEYPIILTQIYVMMYFVLKYKKLLEIPIIPLVTAFYFAGVTCFLMDILPKEILSYLVPLCTPLSGFAKISYIYGIIKTGNAENMSLATWTISVITNLVRVFTVYIDSADSKLMFNFIVSSILSAGVLGTAIFYQTMVCPTHRIVRRKGLRHRSHND